MRWCAIDNVASFSEPINSAITKLKGRQRILRREKQSGNALFVANQNQKMGKSLKFVRVLDVARDVVERRSVAKHSNSI
jgi:hypothetical protein